MTHHYERTHPVHQYQYTPPFIPCLAHAHEHNGGGVGGQQPQQCLLSLVACYPLRFMAYAGAHALHYFMTSRYLFFEMVIFE